MRVNSKNTTALAKQDTGRGKRECKEENRKERAYQKVSLLNC